MKYTETSAAEDVRCTGLLAAVRHEIRVAEKQIELLTLRIAEEPAIAPNVRPFGSNLFAMVKRLKAAEAKAANARK